MKPEIERPGGDRQTWLKALKAANYDMIICNYATAKHGGPHGKLDGCHQSANC